MDQPALVDMGRVPRVSTAEEKTRPSRNLRSNKHHVITDPKPTVHNALKIYEHKGSDKKPLNPLRFRVRWEGCTAKEDTWEPWNNVKDCVAAITYINSKPSLWYLLEPRLLKYNAFNAKEKLPMPWYRMKLLEATGKIDTRKLAPKDKPISRARAEAIAQAVMSVQKFALYDLLSYLPMPLVIWMMMGMNLNTRSALWDLIKHIGSMHPSLNSIDYLTNSKQYA